MKKRPLLLVLLILTSCSEEKAYRLRVAGVDGEFCVPRTGYIAPDIWWVPRNASGVPGGFSFGGCHRLKQPGDRASCSLPDEFISADVESLQSHHNITWEKTKRSADYKLRVGRPGAKLWIDSETGFLVLSNSNVGSDWSIWDRRERLKTDGGVTISDGDELMATCWNIDDFAPGTDGLGSSGEYGCVRYVRGKQYSLKYLFVSKRKIPTSIQVRRLERALFNQVEGWRCGQSKEQMGLGS